MSNVEIRLEAKARRLSEGEIRLTGPLDPPDKLNSSWPLPRVDQEAAETAISSVHRLHAGLADSNSDPAWWYLPVSEWQPNQSALPGIVENVARVRSIKSESKNVLTIRDPFAARYFEFFFKADPTVRVCVRPVDRLSWFFRRAKLPILRWVNIALWLLENWRNHAAVRRAVRLRRNALQVDTLFVSRYESGTGTVVSSGSIWQDRYLGELPAEGHIRTGSVALIVRCGPSPGRTALDVSAYDLFPISTIYEWIRPVDLLRVAWHALRFRLRAPENDDALARVAVAESRGHVRALADCLILERALSVALRRYRPRQIVSMQENGVWEHAVVSAARVAAPSAHLTGFFHCPVMPSSFRYRGRACVMAQRPLFDHTIPLGPNMAASLMELGDWGPRLELGYGFRNPELDSCFALDFEPAADCFRILVVLGGMFDNASFLAWIDRAREGLDGVVFEIRPHPAYPVGPVLVDAGIELHPDGPFRLSVPVGMDGALLGVGCAIYKGSTAGIASLAAGIPVIHIDDGGIASDDCLFHAGHLRSSVGSPLEFCKKIDAIRALSPAERKAWQTEARDYVRNYYDLTETSLEIILNRLFPIATGSMFENQDDNQGAIA